MREKLKHLGMIPVAILMFATLPSDLIPWELFVLLAFTVLPGCVLGHGLRKTKAGAGLLSVLFGCFFFSLSAVSVGCCMTPYPQQFLAIVWDWLPIILMYGSLYVIATTTAILPAVAIACELWTERTAVRVAVGQARRPVRAQWHAAESVVAPSDRAALRGSL